METPLESHSDNLSLEEPVEFIKLFELVSAGDLKSIKNALCVYEITHGKVFNLRIVNKYGLYLIHSAAYYGQRETVEFLLSSVSEVEERDTTMYEAITSDNLSFESNDTEMMSNESKIVPITFGHAKSPSSFINVRSLDQGATPLHFAAMGGNKNNIILYLLACGADPRLKDIKGMTPPELARAHGHKKTEKTIRKYIQAINSKMSH
ncbi:hypothetical protein NEHOM01_0408 [Nematocida homosporus]|uniref:uncharacterized protein n=1 Tax=Nematocida homosporus TaxID=1912981 RepID=UPI00221E53EB|nr:uncharacterized protein NEHOM01_0408 [Nematocida homosporus]KAI5184806.1 hypothetical protein NEHOM01_0408 [Nematocida homosporus]